VLRTGQLGVDDAARRDSAKRLDKCASVLDEHERVAVAVRDEERWGVCVDVRPWRGERRVAPVAAVVAVEAHSGRDGGVDLLEPRLQVQFVRGQRQGRSEVGAGRAACDDDLRSGTVFVPVLADPGDHLLGVDQVVGVPDGSAEPVVRTDAHPAVTREPVEQQARLVVLATAAKRSPVQMDEHRAVRRMGAVPVDVEQVPPAGIPVLDVRDPLDAAAPH
jgi:hypothetical protein